MGSTNKKYKTVIGLEIHVQLNTKRKIFTQEGYRYGQPPNTQTSPITLAHPGTMPTLNKKAIEKAIIFGLSANATIAKHSYFDRKSYSYPDLPKGYQITQDKKPICQGGQIIITTPAGKERPVALRHIQLEEDTGKSIHAPATHLTLINFDRAGMPLIEIVTEPHLHTGEEASAFVREIRRMVRYLDISNGNMEQGALRCDANISIMEEGSKTYGQKVEIKNMNSIRHIRLAIQEEIRRQTAIKEQGGTIASETRSYNAHTGKTIYQRSKENLTDYRFFTEPDLSPFHISEEDLSTIRKKIPPLPRALLQKFQTTYQLSAKDAHLLIDEKATSLFFESLCQHTPHYKAAANWVMGPIKSYLNTEKISWEEFPIPPQAIAKLIDIIVNKAISFSIAIQKIFPQLIANPSLDLTKLLDGSQWQVDNQNQLIDWVTKALATYPEKVKAYQAGKKGLLGLFMGEVMKISHRKAHPEKTIQLLKERLKPS